MWILDELYNNRENNSLAIVERAGSCTFKDLWDHSEYIASDILANTESNNNAPIVLYGDKHHDMVPTMIAALKTGRAYVPVDISFPTERLEYIAKTVNAAIVYNFSGQDINIPFIVHDGTKFEEELYSGERFIDVSKSMWVKDDDVCYYLFTSGSTGVPKGVPIRKRNIINFTSWFSAFINPQQYGQNVLNQASYSCDFSVEILYVYLSLGKTLICVDKPLLKDVASLVTWLSKNNISIWSSTPSFIDMCSANHDFNEKKLPEIRLFVVGGETFNKNSARFINNNFSQASIYNTYGPTEATVECVACKVTHEMLCSERSIPIGTMMPEAQYYIVSEDGKKCNEEEVGELVIISKSVAEGYLNNPEQTKKAFFKHSDGRMGYHTGDLVYEYKGNLYFAGRKDSQVKVGGYRIELEDVENNLNALEEVETGIVIPIKDEDGKVDHLVGFVKLKKAIDKQSKIKNLILIKKELSQKVPSYMIPRKIIFIEDFPLNNTGKIDRKALEKI